MRVLEWAVVRLGQAGVMIVVVVVMVMLTVMVVAVLVVLVTCERFVLEGRMDVLVVAVLMGVDDDLPSRDGCRRDESGQDGRDDAWTQAQDSGSLAHRDTSPGGRADAPLDQVPCGMPVALAPPALRFQRELAPAAGARVANWRRA